MTLMEPKRSPPLSLTQVEDEVDKAEQEDPHAKEVHRRPRIVVIGLVPLKRAEPVRMSNAGGRTARETYETPFRLQEDDLFRGHRGVVVT